MKRLNYTVVVCLLILISKVAESQTRSWQWAKHPDGSLAPYTYFSLVKTIHFDFNKIDTSYRLIAAANNTYGYEIVIKNKVLIRQVTIPSKPGTNGFKTKEDAKKVAQLIIKKLSKGLMPPTIDDKELRELKIKL